MVTIMLTIILSRQYGDNKDVDDNSFDNNGDDEGDNWPQVKQRPNQSTKLEH